MLPIPQQPQIPPPQLIVPPNVPPQFALPPAAAASAPQAAPRIQTRSSSPKFDDIQADWKEAHENLRKTFQELTVIFAEINFLLQELESQLGAAGSASGLDDCFVAGKKLMDGFAINNANLTALNTHINQVDKNVFNNAPAEAQDNFIKIQQAVIKAANVGSRINANAGLAANSPAAQATQMSQFSQLSSVPSAEISQMVQNSQNIIQQVSNNLLSCNQNLSSIFNFGYQINNDLDQDSLSAQNMANSGDQEFATLFDASQTWQQAQQQNQQPTQADQQTWVNARNAAQQKALSLSNDLHILFGKQRAIDGSLANLVSQLQKHSEYYIQMYASVKNSWEIISQAKLNLRNAQQQLQQANLNTQDQQLIQQCEQLLQNIETDQMTAENNLNVYSNNYLIMQQNLAFYLSKKDRLATNLQNGLYNINEINDLIIKNP